MLPCFPIPIISGTNGPVMTLTTGTLNEPGLSPNGYDNKTGFRDATVYGSGAFGSLTNQYLTPTVFVVRLERQQGYIDSQSNPQLPSDKLNLELAGPSQAAIDAALQATPWFKQLGPVTQTGTFANYPGSQFGTPPLVRRATNWNTSDGPFTIDNGGTYQFRVDA